VKNDQEQNPQQFLLTIPEVAQRLSLSRAKIYALIARGEGPPVIHFGRAVRVSVASLQAWLAQYEAEQRGH
jgi:excisionase family DNA binding protein